jgi:nucleotide-binding universal stress UspA family protein
MIFRRRSEAESTLLPYQTLLIPLLGTASDEDPIRLGSLLLADHGGQVVVLHVIEVGFERSLDQTDPAAVDFAHEAVGKAEEFFESHGIAVRTSVVQARSAGPAIVDEAIESQADLVLMGLPYKKRFGGAWDAGRTVPYVMRNLKAPVWCLRTATEDLADTA